MSGHSKWHSIKHKKAAADAKKGAIFTRAAKNISIAAREGGGDPEMNFKLRMAIDQAKAVNMPKDNIARAIVRGTGEGNEAQLQEVVFEGYGPGGVALIIQAITDNNNRTVSDVRRTLQKHGGSLAESGAVMWNFEQKGALRIPKNVPNREQIELAAIDAGADAITEENETLCITTDPRTLQQLKEVFEKKDLRIEHASVDFIPKHTVALDSPNEQKLSALTDALDELEDVNEYFTNAS